MARALAQYVFAALLAMLSAHAVVPSRHLESTAKIVWCAEIEQQAPQLVQPVRVRLREPLATIKCTSHISAPPEASVLFQRPPPHFPLFA